MLQKLSLDSNRCPAYKEGHEGLNVANGKGEQWRAYGDGSFSSPKNKENGDRAVAAYNKQSMKSISPIDSLINIRQAL